MKILGISTDLFLSSAVLIEDGRVVAGAPEERFNRQKLYRGFPKEAVAYCLKEGKTSLADLDCVAVSWNPELHLKPSSQRFGEVLRWRGELLHAVPHALLSLAQSSAVGPTEQVVRHEKGETTLIFVNHHCAHAANAFFLSPFRESAILTIDGRGEEATTGFFVGRGTKIEELKTLKVPHSLGLFYGAFTDFLGFTPHADEWKVMALAAKHFPRNRYYEKIKKLITLLPEGAFELDLSYFDFYLPDRVRWYAPKLETVFGAARMPEEELTARHYEIADALQRVAEEVALHCMHWLQKKTGMTTLSVSGGFFMNSVLNGRITAQTKFKQVFVSSCPDDSGSSLGAALFVHHARGGKRCTSQKENYYGPSFGDREIEESLIKYQISYRRVSEIEKETAALLAAGKIVGWFQGRMEFGQRALGNRSILADPRDVTMKDKVNRSVKYREVFRPFAPSILEEYVDKYFDCDKGTRVPFMEKVFMVRKEKQKEIPAVTHFDGSGRLQTVTREGNPRYYRLIKEFQTLTGVPVVLNTSFNLKGEAIVCSPTDAIRTFFSSGLDALVLGNFLVQKKTR